MEAEGGTNHGDQKLPKFQKLNKRIFFNMDLSLEENP
jgi:hypothetical protein